MARVLIENLTKKFGENVVVDDLSLEVKDGDFVCLLGSPGAGKTTTLRMIAGLEMPTFGSIYIDDILMNDLTPAERDIAMMFQTFALYPHMTVYKNLAFPLKKTGMSTEEIDKRVREVAEMLRITYLLDSKPGTLSGGEKQRLALGRAIVRRPKVYLLDEPLSNLDAKLRLRMRAELKRVQRELGQTTIFTTPDELEALTMADKIAVIDHGKLTQYDATEVVYNHPKNLFVAGFVGSPPMNFIDCIFEEKEGRAFLNAKSFALDVSNLKNEIKKRSTSSELILGVRPSDVSLHKSRPPEENIEAEVYTIEPMGIEAVIDLKVGEHLIKSKVRATFKVDVGQKVWMIFDKNRIHIFDKKTKEAIL